jgi:hypothetical protein
VSFERGEQRAIELLAQIGLPEPFDIVEFCDRVAALRGRPVRLVPEPAGAMGEAVGLFIGLPGRDEIHYIADTSRYHQQAIILHEVGHVLADDDGADVHPFPLELLSGDWDPEVIERLRGRRRYDDEQEREAEGFATAVLDRVDSVLRQGGSGRAAAAEPAGERLASMFLR